MEMHIMEELKINNSSLSYHKKRGNIQIEQILKRSSYYLVNF